MKAGKLTLGVMAGALALASSANAAVFFDPNGTGTFGANELTSFDWSPGNTIARGGNQAVTNFVAGAGTREFTNHYQASLGTYQESGFGGVQLLPAGSEVTVVVGWRERVVNVTGPLGSVNGTATFNYIPTAVEYFEIYVDTNAATQVTGSLAAAQNHLIGQGYNDGQLVLRADIRRVNVTTFTLSNGVGNAGPLDQSSNPFAGDQYEEAAGGTIATVAGNGATTLQAEITEWDMNFFDITGIGGNEIQLTILQDLGVNLPFIAIDPSSGFVVGSDFQAIGLPGQAPDLNVGPGTVAGLLNPLQTDGPNTVGDINGGLMPIFGGGSGPDIVFQTDTNQAFRELQVIPEPISATLSLMGLGALGLVTRRRRTA